MRDTSPTDYEGSAHSHLDDEVADHPAVVRMHPGPECVKNSSHTHFHVGLTVVRVPERERGGEKEGRREGRERGEDEKEREGNES